MQDLPNSIVQHQNDVKGENESSTFFVWHDSSSKNINIILFLMQKFES